MELKIEIDKATFDERTIQTGDNEFIVREQIGYLQMTGERYPQKVVVQLNPNQPAYEPGTYEVMPSSVILNRFGALGFKRVLDLRKLAVENEQAA
jgi:hypothetical protein